MTGKGTARQTFRFDPHLWEWFRQHAPADADRTDLLKAFILWWMHAGELPERPAEPPPRTPLIVEALEVEARRRADKDAAKTKDAAE